MDVVRDDENSEYRPPAPPPRRVIKRQRRSAYRDPTTIITVARDQRFDFTWRGRIFLSFVERFARPALPTWAE